MFIVLEGIDGCGKTTQAARLERWLSGITGNDKVLLTREPGGWTGGDAVRELILNGDFSTAWGEFFMFMADRCEHVARVIAPALADGFCVLCDRYIPSTMAYQVYSNPEISSDVADYMTRIPDMIKLPSPDCVCLLDIAPEKARRRLDARGKGNSFDARGLDFFERVCAGFDEMMRRSEESWMKVDASRSEEDVFVNLKSGLERRFQALQR